MTQLVQRRTFPEIIRDHHTRIRRLEMTPGGGGSEAAGSECDRCYYVNPDDIYVPPELRDCTTGVAGSYEFGVVCGTFGTTLGSFDLGPCGMAQLGFGVAVRILINFAAPGEMENVLINGEGASFGVGESPAQYDSGWYLLAAQPCGLSCEDIATITATFYAANSGFGNCTLNGAFYAKWVALNEDDEWMGALDEIPAGEAYGDVIYFLPGDSSPRWRSGARSIPSRAVSFFNSVIVSILHMGGV